MKRDRFLAENIMCEIYWNKNHTNNKLALYQYGFPGSIGKNPLINYLTELGFTIIVPHFPGTFDSGGDFTPINTYRFYKSIYDTIEKGNIISLKKNKPLVISSNKIEYAFGHSYGCWSLLRGVEFLKHLKSVFLFGPAITYAELNYPSNCGLIENGKDHIDMVKRTRPFTYRLNDVNAFDKLYKGEYDNFSVSDNASLQKIIGVVGTDDSYFDLVKLKSRFPDIILSSFGDVVEQKLLLVEEGTHSLESLLNVEFKNELGGCL